MNKYLIELIGTFFLVFVIALTGNPIAIGAILTAMVYMGGYISGAHYNPAVTLAVLIRGKITAKDTIFYMLAQITGAFLAAVLFWSLSGEPFIPTANQEISPLSVGVLELIFTFALASVVLHVATSDKVKDNFYYGIAIGLTVMAGVVSVGSITGAVFNPAVGIGPMLLDIQNFASHGAKLLTYLGSYVLAPFLGAIGAALVYRLTNRT